VRSSRAIVDVVHDDVGAESSGSPDDRDGLGDLVDGIAADVGLSGVIRIDLDGSLAVQRAYGLAHRGLGVPNTVDTLFATASGTKGLTALTVMSLVERGELGLDTPARSVLALLVERASGVPFHDLVDARVCPPAGMTDTSFLRSDELPGRAAVGYLDDDGLRTNVLHLPVRGNGDGGVYTTAADVYALWDALFAGRIVSLATVTEMMRPRSDVPELSMRYGLGFWLDDSTGTASLQGGDAGVGFVSTPHRDRRVTATVLCNQTRGAWPVSQRLNQLLAAST
jgi:CubicO group peptidase (beta-lactamase class C family)